MQLVALSFTSTLQGALSLVFNEVLTPVLVIVFNTLVSLIGDLISELLGGFLFQIWVILLKIVAFAEDIFNIFAGLSSVAVYDELTGDYVSTGKSFLDYLFSTDAIQATLWGMVVIGFVLVLLTTILATLNSMGDSIMDNKRPISTVIRSALKATFTVVTIPAVCLMMLGVMNTVTLVISEEVFGENDDDISDTVFITLAGSAAKTTALAEEYAYGHAYENDDAIDDFNTEQINYIYAYVITAFIAVLLLLSIMQFIQRIFMILLLSLVAPFIAASIPMDDGKKFNDWKKQFLAYSIGVIGPVMAMRIYLIIVGNIIGSGSLIAFSTSSTISGMVEVMLLVGGMYAIYCSRNLYVTIIDPQVAQSMDASMVIITAPAQFVGGKMKERRDEKRQEKKERERAERYQ